MFHKIFTLTLLLVFISISLIADAAPKKLNDDSMAKGGKGGGKSKTPTYVFLDTHPDFKTAYEKSGSVAIFRLRRDQQKGRLAVNFQLSGDASLQKGSALPNDYILKTSTGQTVSSFVEFNSGVSEIQIEVHPIKDSIHEVPEALTLTLLDGDKYLLSEYNSAQISICDAEDLGENEKIFIGQFAPQPGVSTIASGVASLRLNGPNTHAYISYTFSNLGSEQIDQHIHMLDGPMLKDIPDFGPIQEFKWDFALDDGLALPTQQTLLDTLFEGLIFVNIHTSTYPAGEIRAFFIFDAPPPPVPDTEITEKEVDLDIIRFLNQATFGATPETYRELRDRISLDGRNREQVYSDWIDQQFLLPTTSLLGLTDLQRGLFINATGELEPSYRQRRDAIWTIATQANDQLRQRMAFALSQILVVSEEDSVVKNAHRGCAHYWDTLANLSFDSYRTILEAVTRHPIMGAYLSHLRNAKADPTIGYDPDENYAREIMQLFTFGLVQRNLDGSVKLDQNYLPIETYDNAVIKEMAQVFSGMSFSKYTSNGVIVDNTRFYRSNYTSSVNQIRWINPMKYFSDYHDYSEKVLFSDGETTLVIPANINPDEELSMVLDGLVAHSSTAPYVSLRLIQRFVTSNPSPAYITRVAQAFGDRGDMKSIIKAILLDAEARTPSAMKEPGFGKLKEPVIQLTGLMRLLHAHSQIVLGSEPPVIPNPEIGHYNLQYSFAHHFDPDATLLRVSTLNIGQKPLDSPTVFNFYSPDFSPAGELAKQSLVAPELQLVTETQVYSTMNTYHNIIRRGMRHTSSYFIENPIFPYELHRVLLHDVNIMQIWNETIGEPIDKAKAVSEFLDFYLNAGRLAYLDASTSLESMISVLAQADETNGDIFDLAVYGAAVLPGFMVQK